MSCSTSEKTTLFRHSQRPGRWPWRRSQRRYAHAGGIIRPGAAVPQEVVLRFRPEQGRYALNYPLHASQRLVRQSATETVLTLSVFDTHYLHMELLSYGPEVAVLAPPTLRGWFGGLVVRSAITQETPAA